MLWWGGGERKKESSRKKSRVEQRRAEEQRSREEEREREERVLGVTVSVLPVSPNLVGKKKADSSGLSTIDCIIIWFWF